MAYASDNNGVEILCPDITVSGVFSTSTTPTTAQVDLMQEDASLYIDMRLSAAGFTVPVPSGETEAVSWLAPIEELITAGMCYLVRFQGRATVADLEAEGTGRPSHLFRRAETLLKYLLEDDGRALTGIGLTKTGEVGTAIATAMVIDDKQDVYDDDDNVQARFKKDMFRMPGGARY